ncbi:hypothetical protein D3C76_418700 [compost metagenome]
MASRAAHLQMTGACTPRQAMWEAIRRQHCLGDGTIATYAVARASSQDDEAVRSYLMALARAGIVRKLRNLPKRNAEWELLRDQGAEAPKVTKTGTPIQLGQGTENVWRALRILGELDAAEASTYASVGDVRISPKSARDYLQGLHLAGYVSRSGGTPGVPARYRLIPTRNTGPLHPIYQRCTFAQMFDPNLGEVVWRKGETPDPTEANGLRIEAARLRNLLRRLLAATEEHARPSPELIASIRQEVSA